MPRSLAQLGRALAAGSSTRSAAPRGALIPEPDVRHSIRRKAPRGFELHRIPLARLDRRACRTDQFGAGRWRISSRICSSTIGISTELRSAAGWSGWGVVARNCTAGTTTNIAPI
jgi:hypothetical protein